MMDAGALKAPEPACDARHEASEDHHQWLAQSTEATGVMETSATSGPTGAIRCAESVHVSDPGCFDRQVSDYGAGTWAVGPEDLHGGPKLGEGFASSTGGGPALQATATSTASDAFQPGCVSAGVRPVGLLCDAGVAATESTSQPPGIAQKKSAVKWDEETIAEHDLERGTRQKIEEPKTPWMMGSPGNSARESVIHASTPVAHPADSAAARVSASATRLVEEEVEERLQGWLRKEGHRASIQEQWTDLGTAAGNVQTVPPTAQELSLEEKKAQDFAEKRKMHYKVDLKALRAAVPDDSDEEDESDDEDAA